MKKKKEFSVYGKHSGAGRLVCCLILCVSLFLTACGKDNTTDANANNANNHIPSEKNAGSAVDTADSVQGPEWVYVPELIEINDERVDYGRMQQVGDSVCYISMNGEAENEVQNICWYSLTDKELTRTPIDWPMEEKNRDVCSYVFDQDCSVWLIVNVYSADYSQLSRFLCKFDSEGKNLYSREITEQMGRGISIGHMAVDKQGQIYVFSSEYTDEEGIWLYTADGSYHGSISYGSLKNIRVKGTAEGEDGRFYACISAGEEPDHCTLMEVDFAKSQLTELIGDFPKIDGFCVGTQAAGDSAEPYDFLLYDNTSVYGYDLSAQDNGSGQTAEELFVWGDSDVNGYFVKRLGILGDGRYFCTVEDWLNDDRGIVLLTKTSSEEAPKRENIVLASVGGEGSLAALAVRFSRGSDQYHLTVKNYDSLTELYNALLTKETIDIIDLSGVDVKKLSGQGVFADLTPFLEQSEALEPSDFLDGILKVYTFDGTLVGIPESFTLRTVVGDRTLPGSEAGLSLDGMLAATGRNPGALPFDEMTKEEMMQYIMMFNEDTFIDRKTGQCHFDSEQFRAVLEYVNLFPDSLENSRKEVSLPTKIQNGQVLFAVADLWGLDTFQLYEGIFGENAACVGFPTRDGRGGTLLFPRNAYGITAVSENQSGAWEFIENVLTQVNVDGMEKKEVYNAYSFPTRFPSLKKTLDIITEYNMERDSQRESDRFPIQMFEEDGWYYQYHAVTQDDVNVILELVKEAAPAFSVENDNIINIINEEAQAYYSGQKGTDDVAGIIQNRVQNYLSENS